MINWEKEWENIERMITNGDSYESIGRKYGCTGNYIRKTAIKKGLVLPKRRKINPKETFNRGSGKKCKNCGRPLHSNDRTFCCQECRNEFTYKCNVEKWKNGEIDGFQKDGTPQRFVKRYLFEKNDCKCEKCGYDKINQFTGKSILQIHHIDGDCFNTSEDNLQLLCPNCHALTENFGSRNKRATRFINKKK